MKLHEADRLLQTLNALQAASTDAISNITYTRHHVCLAAAEDLNARILHYRLDVDQLARVASLLQQSANEIA